MTVPASAKWRTCVSQCAIRGELARCEVRWSGAGQDWIERARQSKTRKHEERDIVNTGAGTELMREVVLLLCGVVAVDAETTENVS